MKKIAILVSPHLALFELGCATDLFAVNRDNVDWYQTQVVSFFPSPLTVSSQAHIHINVTHVNNLDGYDMVVIPSWAFSRLHLPEPMKLAILDLPKSRYRKHDYSTTP
ncbi:MAG: hypothetical protein L3J83_03155 [Proteobacteria bacterium]|nr:hypothetical protein [Pseudomonadota bacterium]